jgi:drug/metabolite transporter (DMT)-like permease
LDWKTPDVAAVAMMGGVGLIGLVGYFCVNRALQLAPASVVAPFQYLSIVWSVVLGYATFGDVPQATTLLGASLIIGAGAFILFRERSTAG